MSNTNDLLTVILTTSVTPSAPSTELLETVLESFNLHCPSLLTCKVIVIFDGYDQIVPKARLKKGQVTPEQARDFDIYKENVKKLVLERYCRTCEGILFTATEAEAEYGSPCNPQNAVPYKITRSRNQDVTFLEPERRLGFGLAVRSALRITETPYVWVQQHDWTLVFDFPIDPLLQIMRDSKQEPEVPVKYVCLSAIRMLSYATSDDVMRYPALRDLTSSLKRDFILETQPSTAVPLTPMFFWHDKPHVASTAHYLESVFPTRLAMLRGDFIEDKIGQRARAQMKEGLWTRWATWLYYPDEGKQLCLRHLKGRTWRGKQREADQAAIWKEKQRGIHGYAKETCIDLCELGDALQIPNDEK